ncbi:MAG TPA: GspH/FimT family pseudopilin [Burkholderiales bacterium]|jgi:general secretion pathway protein H|nr:GspH/FimT family pseudopilin [Burkholderiales bacterium]
MEPVDPFQRRAARGGGFTLIEVLVVLAIMAIVAAAVVVVAIPGDAAAAREEARRLAALLEAAMRDARASGHSIAWSAEPQRYAFWQRGEDGDWVLYPRTSPYRARALAGRTELTRVLVDGRELAPGERVVFAPNGLRSELSATMAGAGEQFTIQGDVIGRVSLARVHAY